MPKPKRKGLGRGLDALLESGSVAPEAALLAEGAPAGDRLLELDPRALRPNPRQPRHDFNEEALEELADSIRRDGIQEPVIVRQAGAEYELVSGERRVRAAVMADCATIPALCRDVSDADMLRLGLIENIQREDLRAIDLARAYQELIDEFTWTQEELAGQVGKKRVTVTNTLRLLNLPAEVQRLVTDGSLTTGHAKALLALDSAKAQSAAARKVVARGLSVRQTERLAAPKPPKAPKDDRKDPNIARIEDDLRRRLGAQVHLRSTRPDRGRIEIAYFSLDELERLLDLLRG